MNPHRPNYDEAKFAELVLYVAAKCERLPKFGATKLNKVLFFSDFLSYQNRGKPITGAVYQKIDHGPAPVRLLPVKTTLEQTGAAIMRHDPLPSGYVQKRLIPLRAPNLALFDAEEISIVDDVIEELAPMTAVQVSECSHEFPGWQLAAAGEEIPYFTALLPGEPVEMSQADRDWAEQVMRASSVR